MAHNPSFLDSGEEGWALLPLLLPCMRRTSPGSTITSPAKKAPCAETKMMRTRAKWMSRTAPARLKLLQQLKLLHRKKSSGRRYLKRTESYHEPKDGEFLELRALEEGLGSPSSASSSPRDGIDRQVSTEEFRPRDNDLTARHRRTKSHYMARHSRLPSMNGFDYYKYMQQHRRLSSLVDPADFEELRKNAANANGASVDPDDEHSQSFTVDDMRRTRQILSTIRVRRRSRRQTRSVHGSMDRRRSSFVDPEPCGSADEGEGEYIEEVGLPSDRPPVVSLTQRLLLAKERATAQAMSDQYR